MKNNKKIYLLISAILALCGCKEEVPSEEVCDQPSISESETIPTSEAASENVSIEDSSSIDETCPSIEDSSSDIIVSGEVKEGSNFWVVNDFSIPAANVYEPPATGTQLTVQLSNVGLAGTGTFTSTAVPEPASAMLALAGVAMLIRRRK
jgi:hypothetical protein